MGNKIVNCRCLRALEKDKYIYFNAGNHVQTVRLAFKDFVMLVKPQIARLVEPRVEFGAGSRQL